jgi:hypothetical protein
MSHDMKTANLSNGTPMILMRSVFLIMMATGLRSGAAPGCAPMSFPMVTENALKADVPCHENSTDEDDSSVTLPYRCEQEVDVGLKGRWDQSMLVGRDWAFVRNDDDWSLVDLHAGTVRKLPLPLDLRFHQGNDVLPGLVILRDGSRSRIEDVKGRVLIPSVEVDTSGLNDEFGLDRFCPISDSLHRCWQVGNGNYPPGLLAGPNGFLALDARQGVPSMVPVSWSIQLPGAPGLLYGQSGKVGLVDSAGRFVTPAEYDGFTCLDTGLRLVRGGHWGDVDAKGAFISKGEMPGPRRVEFFPWLATMGIKELPQPGLMDLQRLPMDSRDTFWYTASSTVPDSIRGHWLEKVSVEKVRGAQSMQMRVQIHSAGAERIQIEIDTLRVDDARTQRVLRRLRRVRNTDIADVLLKMGGKCRVRLPSKPTIWEHWQETALAAGTMHPDQLEEAGQPARKAWYDAGGRLSWWDSPMRHWPSPRFFGTNPAGEEGESFELYQNHTQYSSTYGTRVTQHFLAKEGNHEAWLTLGCELGDMGTLRVIQRDSVEREWTWTRVFDLKNSPHPGIIVINENVDPANATLELTGYTQRMRNQDNALVDESTWRVDENKQFRIAKQRHIEYDAQKRVVRIQIGSE